MECNAGMASIFKSRSWIATQHHSKIYPFPHPNTLIDWANIPITVAKIIYHGIKNAEKFDMPA